MLGSDYEDCSLTSDDGKLTYGSGSDDSLAGCEGIDTVPDDDETLTSDDDDSPTPELENA